MTTFHREQDFEEALIEMLTQKGWESEVLYQPSEEELLRNWADIIYQNNKSIDRLGNAPLTEGEMRQLLDKLAELRTPVAINGFINSRTTSIKRDNPDAPEHLGREVSIELFNPHEIAAGKSRYQIVRQPRFVRASALLPDRRGDVMLLINGMPVIHIELKRSGVPLSQAYFQIEKYSREGIFSGLFSLIQIFVAMTPSDMVYFANPGSKGRFNTDFYFHWADFNNQPRGDWQYIATYLLSIPMAHQLIGYYTIADRTDGVLKVLRSYQYEAVRAIHDRVVKRRDWQSEDKQLGGFIWHTTGSGKTLSSFKAAQLIASSGHADKVVFVIDRIELGTQSVREYRNFSAVGEEIQETEDTDVLVAKLKLETVNDSLIVTSIQKLNILAEDEARLSELQRAKPQRVVFIVDECHRSTFGDSFVAIKRAFPRAMFFGFTGTPIQEENKRKDCTTSDIFGDELHRYSIADGIRDKNVLGFDPIKVLTYKDKDLRRSVALRKAGVSQESEVWGNEERERIYDEWMTHRPMVGAYQSDGTYLAGVEDEVPSEQYEYEGHCRAVVSNILEDWQTLSRNGKFHAILATNSIPQAIHYYRLFKELAPWLKATALFDPNLPNDNPEGVLHKEEGLVEILRDYAKRYGQSFDISGHARFKKDLSSRLAHKQPYLNPNPEAQIDLLIVVSQMLTGFDSKYINTLYIDKKMEYADLIQAFSRTNRLYGPEKPFGIIKYYYRPHTMERNITEAVRLYSGDAPLGLFVSKLKTNLEGMCLKFSEMTGLFESAGVMNFSRLPEEEVLRARFAVLFRDYNRYLEAAKVQGFHWDKLKYQIEGNEIIINHDEHLYNTLLKRYKELFREGGDNPSSPSGGGDFPYEIEPYLTEIDTERIDNDYMNRNFVRYVKALEQENVSPEELQQLLSELSASFASLSQEEQKFAEILLHDIQSKEIVLEGDKSFREYIAEYMADEQEREINKLVDDLGLDKDLLKTLIARKPTAATLDEFGYYTKLKSLVDREKAKQYFEKETGKTLSGLQVNIQVDTLLREFIL